MSKEDRAIGYNLVNEIDKKIEKYLSFRDLAQQIEELRTVDGFIDEDGIELLPSSFDELHEARATLREVFGSWNDRIVRAWGDDQKARIIYRDKRFRQASIRLDIPYEQMPTLHDGCRFVPSSSGITYRYSCTR